MPPGPPGRELMPLGALEPPPPPSPPCAPSGTRRPGHVTVRPCPCSGRAQNTKHLLGPVAVRKKNPPRKDVPNDHGDILLLAKHGDRVYSRRLFSHQRNPNDETA